jgi:hypothetical protein
MATKKAQKRSVTRKSLKKKAVKRSKTAPKRTTRRVVAKASRKTAKKTARKAAKKAAPKTKPKTKTAVAKKAAPRKVVAKKVAKKPARKAPRKAAPKTLPPPASLNRERRRLPELDTDLFDGTGDDTRLLNSARSGHDESRSERLKHTEASPELTGGDVDARWQDAYAVGDEAPGGDNPTPDQDRVDDIGKALGVEYDDDAELMGGNEISDRDTHRWELDPASRDDDEQ